MNLRSVALSANRLLFVSILAGCGDYSQPKEPATGGGGGQAPTGGGSGSGGTGPAGSGGTSGQAGGGAGGTAGQAGGGAGGGGAGGSGAGGGAGGCTAVAACGGNVVGTWTAAACPLTVTGTVDVSGLGLALDCMSGPVTGMLQVSGTITLNADGTFMDGTTTMGMATFELPAPCLELSGTRTTCDMIDGPIQSVGFRELTCLNNAATMGCSCTGVVNQNGGLGMVSINADMTGTYTIAANTLTTDSFGHRVPYEYCVAGNTLTMSLEAVSKTGEAMGPIVLQK